MGITNLYRGYNNDNKLYIQWTTYIKLDFDIRDRPSSGELGQIC